VVTFREVLLDLMDLPGATYSCVADRVSGTLLGEVGTSSVPPGVVMEWGGSAAGFLASAGGDGLDDLMITSHRFYHLVRPVETGPRQLLMIYLCLDRGRSNLAAARRELAASWLRRQLAVASVGPAPQAPGGPSEPLPRRSAPAALPVPRHDLSPGVSLRPPPRFPGPPAGPGGPRAVPDDPGRAPAAGPERGRATGHRPPGSHVPLPRRQGPSRVPPPVPVEVAPIARPITAQSWATDVGTMRRLLTALRSLH
jgi:hypothetical protein